jgi:hypothetical protein
MYHEIFKNLKELQQWQSNYFTFASRHAEFHRETYKETTDKQFMAWPNEVGRTDWKEWGSSQEEWGNMDKKKPGPVHGISALLTELEKLDNPNEKKDNRTLLHAAVAHMKGYANIVKALLKNEKSTLMKKISGAGHHFIMRANDEMKMQPKS